LLRFLFFQKNNS